MRPEINDELLDRLSQLAYLEFNAEERARLKKDFQKILELIDQLNQLPLDEVEPLIHISAHVQRLRPDEPQEPLPREEVLRRAPLADSDYIKVPPVLDKE